ncbi:hypothetical protein ACFX4S_21620 [Kosakonia sp. YIM B13605]|uniref:hypothetical protein n=1 Tax=Kosakonia TaxID=1330547 RepID=UPI0028AF3E3B|nr:hypothetical protein [Kosakonia sacchari]
MKIKNEILQKAVEIIPAKDFYHDMATFIRHPEIYDGEHEYTPLQNALANLFKSLMSLLLLITLIKGLMLDNSLIADFNSVINPLALQVILFIHAMTATIAFGSTISILTFLSEGKIYKVYFLQVIQTWSIISLLALILSWMALNRLLENGTTNIAINSFDLWFGGFIGLLIFYLLGRLIVKPVFNHLRQKYNTFISTIIVFVGMAIALLSIAYIPTGLSDYLVSKKALCNIVYQKNIQPEFDNARNKNIFLTQCLKE